MSSATNQHGLSRDIPDAVQREVRQRCGFGCVVCGCAIYEYEHVDPTFANARSHDPAAIALLCPGCHGRVTRKLLSKETVKARLLAPASKASGFSFGPFDFGNEHPDVVLGSVRAIRTHTIIQVLGEPVLAISRPEQPGGPFRLSATLKDSHGATILQIAENEWRTPTSNWDVTVVGQRITVRRGPGDITLVLRHEPPKAVVIERMDMIHRGTRLLCDERKGFRVETSWGKYFSAQDATLVECWVVINVGQGGLSIGEMCRKSYFGRAEAGPLE